MEPFARQDSPGDFAYPSQNKQAALRFTFSSSHHTLSLNLADCPATMAKCSRKGGSQKADKRAPRWLEMPDLNEGRHRGANSTRSRGKKQIAFKKKPKSLKPRHSQPPFGANARHVNRGRGELEPSNIPIP